MSDPVTVVIRRTIKPGFETAYEDWLNRLTVEAKSLEGYMGAEFHRPLNGSSLYTSVVRFKDIAALEAFEDSDMRARFLVEVAPLVQSDAIWDRMTGLELWFEPPSGTQVPQPSPHRMTLVLIAVVFCLVLALSVSLEPVIGHWPRAPNLLLTVTLQVGLMTYIIMPRLTRVLARWIYPTTRTKI